MGIILISGFIMGVIVSFIFCFFTERGFFYTAILFLLAVVFCLAMFLFVDNVWGWFIVALLPAFLSYSFGGSIGVIIGQSLKKTTLGKLADGNNYSNIFKYLLRLMEGSNNLIIYKSNESQNDKQDNKKRDR